MVEVKVDVRDLVLGVAELVDQLLVGPLDRQLVALLVDEVDEVVATVPLDLVVKVQLGGVRGGLANLQVGLVLEVDDLAPVHGDGASGLQVGEDTWGLGGAFDDEQLLGLVEVCHVAVGVNSSSEVPGAGSVSRSSGDDTKGDASAIDGALGELHKAKGHGGDEQRHAGLGTGGVNQIGAHVLVPEEPFVSGLERHSGARWAWLWACSDVVRSQVRQKYSRELSRWNCRILRYCCSWGLPSRH